MVGTGELLFLGVGLLLGSLWIAGLYSQRSPESAMGGWLLAWAALLSAGVALAAGQEFPVANYFGYALVALFAPLMLVGALQYVGRRVPVWIVPLGIAMGLLRIAGLFAGEDRLAHAVPLLYEPFLLLAAAAIVHRNRTETRSPWASAMLSVGFVALAVVRVADSLIDVTSDAASILWVAWVSVAIPTATTQVMANFERIHRIVRNSESELRSRNEHFEALLNSLGKTRVVLFDRDGDMLSIFGATEDIDSYGVRPGSATGANPLDYLRPENGAELIEAIRKVYDSGQVCAVDVDVELPGGKFHVEMGLSPVRDRQGRVENVIGVMHDVTDRESVARALRESEQHLIAILTSLAQHRIVLLDRDGNVQSIVGRRNEHARSPLDLDESLERLFATEAPCEIRDAARATFNDGTTRDLRKQVHAHGRTSHYAISLVPLRGIAGEIQSTIAVCIDVTQQTQDEERQQKLESQLLQAQKLESLGVLAGGVAHDFNNLLNGIIGNAELALRETPPGHSIRPLLVDVERAGERAADLTRQLLAYAGKAPVSPVPLDLAAEVSDMSALLRSTVRGPSKLTMSTPPEGVWIRADAASIKQLTANLVSNAAEALTTDAGRIEIEIGAFVADAAYLAGVQVADDLESGEYVYLEVRDNGVGMDEETRQRIFDPFFTTKFEGRGLGLAAALGIVRSHGGLLRVSSEPNGGSCFRAAFPRIPAPLASQPPARENAPDVPSACILVVDDDDRVRRVTTRILNHIGHRTCVARDGREALVLFQSQHDAIDAVMLDLTMPDWNGERVAREIRLVAPEVPILFMSGHSDADAADRTRGTPRSAFLQKPFKSADVDDALRTLLA